MTKLPSAIPVLGEMYTVERVPRAEIDDCRGECCPIGLTIKIAVDLKGAELKKIFNHELGHAYLHESGLAEFLPDESQEQAVTNLANLLGSIYTCEFLEHLLDD